MHGPMNFKKHVFCSSEISVEHLSEKKNSSLPAISTNNFSIYSPLHKLRFFFQITQITQFLPNEGGNWNTD